MKGLLPFIIALGVVSGQQTTKVISVNDPRPLSEAILKLEKATGQPFQHIAGNSARDFWRNQ